MQCNSHTSPTPAPNTPPHTLTRLAGAGKQSQMWIFFFFFLFFPLSEVGHKDLAVWRGVGVLNFTDLEVSL